MVFSRGGGRGTILLGPLRLYLLGRGMGAFYDTRPGLGRPGRMVAIAPRKGLSAILRMRLWRPPGGKVRAHG